VLRATRVKGEATLYVLYRAIHESIFEKIGNAKFSKEVCDILEKAYKGDNRV